MGEAREKAFELKGWLQSACQDVAGGDEAEADVVYNDEGVLQDMLGDRINDMTRGNNKMAVEIIEALEENAHVALVEACKEMKKLFTK